MVITRLLIAGVFSLAWAIGGASYALAGDASIGKKKARTCLACHSEKGRKAGSLAPSLFGQPEKYLATQIRDFQTGKRKQVVMTMAAAQINEADIDDIAAWYASVKVTVHMPK